MKSFIPLIALAFALSACQPAPVIPPEAYEAPRFNTQLPLTFNVEDLRVAQDFVPSFRAPNVEHLFQISPAEATLIWAKDRLRTAGARGVLEMTILDGSVRESSLPVKDGIAGYFTREPSERYDARLVVELKLYDGLQRLPAAETVVEVTHSQTIQEDSDIYAREQLFADIIDALMQQLNTKMNAQITTHFQPYLIATGR